MLEDFESISPTAIVTSYPRTFTDMRQRDGLVASLFVI